MYNYEVEKRNIFSEDGIKMLLSIRDNVKCFLKRSGAVRLGEAIAGQTGDSWTMIACIDYLVELGELKEITDSQCMCQHRVFIEG
jgi:hypothetical protein